MKNLKACDGQLLIKDSFLASCLAAEICFLSGLGETWWVGLYGGGGGCGIEIEAEEVGFIDIPWAILDGKDGGMEENVSELRPESGVIVVIDELCS